MFWIWVGGLILLYCLTVRVRLGKLRSLRIVIAGGIGSLLLGGLIPVISEKNGRFMNEEINGITVPEDMIAAFRGADREEGEKLGRRFTDELCGRILPSVDGIYLMTPFHRIALMERIVGDIQAML